MARYKIVIGVDAAQFEQVVASGYLDKRSEVATGGNWKAYERHSAIQKLDRLHIQTETIVLFIGLPALESNGQVELMGKGNGRNAEEIFDVENPEATYLQMIAHHLGGGAEELIESYPPQLDNIIRDQTMAANYQIERALALTDPALALKQHAYTEKIQHDAVQRDTGREPLLEEFRQFDNGNRADLGCYQDRQLGIFRLPQELLRRDKTFRNENGSYLSQGEAANGFQALLWREFFEILYLALAHYLNPPAMYVVSESGKGKRTVMKAFEDLGYFCVDNLPIALVPKFVELCRRTNDIDHAALVIDARERRFLTQFPPMFEELKSQSDLDISLIFLEASDDALMRRFSETRRPHPLVETTDNLLEAIRAEKKLIEPIRNLADLIVDTSNHTVHTLRAYFVDEFSTLSTELDMMLTIMSFGYKHGMPHALDLLLDVRFLPNPHFVPDLKPLTGRHNEVVDFMMKHDEVGETIERFNDLLLYLVPRYKREGRSYLTIGVGCTGGQHRSVMVAEALTELLRKAGYKAHATHRDIAKR